MIDPLVSITLIHFRISTGPFTSHLPLTISEAPEIAQDASSALIQLYLLIPYILLLYWTDWILDYTCWWRCGDDNDVRGEEVLRLCFGWVALPKLFPSALNSAIPSQPLHPLIVLSWSNPRLGMLMALLCLFDVNDVGGEELFRFGSIECLCFFTVFSEC